MPKTLSPEQLVKFRDSIGDGKDFPKITDDPYVNHMVDRSLDDEIPEWDDLEDDDKQMYITEAARVKQETK